METTAYVQAQDVTAGDKLFVVEGNYYISVTYAAKPWGKYKFRISGTTAMGRHETHECDPTDIVEMKRGFRMVSKSADGSLRQMGLLDHVDVTSAREAQAFAKRGMTTMGFKITYAANPETGEVIELFTGKGGPTMKVCEAVVSHGFTHWMTSAAWATGMFTDPAGNLRMVRKLDLTTHAEVAPWLRAFGAEVV